MKKEKTITITTRIKEKWVNKLKKVAREKAFKNDEDISYHDLIKEAIYEKWIKD